MSIQEDLDTELKTALKAKDAPTSGVIRMLKSRIQERTTAKGFSGEVNDELWRDVIGAYRKQMKKAVAEYEKLGEKGAEQLSQIEFEVAFCERYLPKQMGEDELRALVAEKIAELGVDDPRQAGKLIGAVMKTHKGQVEAADVKRVAEAILAG